VPAPVTTTTTEPSTTELSSVTPPGRPSLSPHPPASTTPVHLIPLASGATWYSAAGVVPFHPAEVDPRGYGHIRSANYELLEDGTAPEFLTMHPEWKPNGWIIGDFTLPEPIVDGQRFLATVGFVKARGGNVGAVTFIVQAGFANGSVSAPLVSQYDVQADGRMPHLDVDLSSVRGATNLLLRVEAGAMADQDWAAWVDPRIEPR
jgi:hypothetical protein